MQKTLRILRIILSMAVFLAVTAALTYPSLMIPAVSGWLERIQIGPAVISYSVFIFIIWLIITLIFGRIYCSTVCPLGTLQDIGARIPRIGRRNAARRRYRYTRPATALRYSLLGLTVICALLGFAALPSVLEPMSAYTRVCNAFFRPLLAFMEKALASAGIVSEPLAIATTATVGASIVATFIFTVAILVSAHSGRTLCNTLCPVGTVLGCVSRYSIIQMDIDTDLCIQCGRCADVCKSSCIDLNDHVVDGSRCVVCFDCTDVCPNNAMRYTWDRKRLATPLMQRTGTTATPQTSLDQREASAVSTEIDKPIIPKS